jgi:paraquat-inducible protein B
MAAARPAVIGAFVLGGLGLVAAGILLFGGGRIFEHTTRAVTFFEGSVAGLNVGAPVTFRGVRVGSVERITILLSKNQPPRVPVYLELQPEVAIEEEGNGAVSEPDIERLVANGLRAQLKIESFVTGQFRIELDFLPATPANLVQVDTHGVPQIPSVPTELERLRSTLADVPIQEVVAKVLHTLTAAEQLADSLNSQLTPLLAESRGTVSSATRALDAAGEATARIQADVSETLRRVNELATAAQKQVDGRGAELAEVLATADRVGSQAERLLVSVNELTDPRSRFRVDLEAGARDLAASAASLRGFARAIERDPSAILRGRSAR